MTDTLESLLRRFDEEHLGSAERWSIGKQAERLAEDSGDARALYDVRMRLVGIARDVSDMDAQLSLFLWCAFTNDQDPARFPARPLPEHPEVDLLWWYKWLIGSLLARPQYSLQQIRTSLAMMEAAYRREGAGQAGVLWARLQLAMELGDREGIESAFASIRNTPADAYSHCDACTRASTVSIRFMQGRTREALDALDDLLNSHDLCGEEPEAIISETLIDLCRDGQVERAAQLQEESYPRIMSMPVHLSLQAMHMLFFAQTGNPGHAYTLLTRHLPNLWHSGVTPASTLHSLTTLLRVARILELEGHGELELPAEGGGTQTVRDFAVSARARAAELADQFDQRNGNTAAADALTRAEQNLTERWMLDLGGTEVLAEPEREGAVDQLQLAKELAYIARGMDDPNRADHPARIAAANASGPAQKAQALMVLLQHEGTEDWDELFEQFLAAHDELGHDEFVLKQRRFGQQLWRDRADAALNGRINADRSPADQVSAGVPAPVFDPFAELLEAQSPIWRLECLLAVAPSAGAILAQWLQLPTTPGLLTPDDVPYVGWTQEANELLDAADTTPLDELPELADRIQRELAQQVRPQVGGNDIDALQAEDMPSPAVDPRPGPLRWDTVIAGIIVNAKLTGSSHPLPDALREGLDQIDPMRLVLQAFDIIADPVDHALEILRDASTAANEVMGRLFVLMVRSRLTTPASDIITLVEQIVDRVEHPYQRAQLWLMASRVAPPAQAVRYARLALIAVDRSGIDRSHLSAAERDYLQRSTPLRALAHALSRTRDHTEHLAVLLELLHEDRAQPDVVVAYGRLIANQGIGDPFDALNRTRTALALTTDPSEKASLLAVGAALRILVGDDDAGAQQLAEALTAIDELDDPEASTARTVLIELAQASAATLPEVALHISEQLLGDMPLAAPTDVHLLRARVMAGMASGQPDVVRDAAALMIRFADAYEQPEVKAEALLRIAFLHGLHTDRGYQLMRESFNTLSYSIMLWPKDAQQALIQQAINRGDVDFAQHVARYIESLES